MTDNSFMNQRGGQYGSGQQRQTGFTKAGYQQIIKVNRNDRWWYLFKVLAQLLLILMVCLGMYISYGYYRGMAIYKEATAFWALMAMKLLCDFMMGRLK